MYMSASCTKGRGETASTGRGARRSWGLLDAHTVSWRSRVGALRESDEDDGATVPWCIYGAHGLVDCRSCHVRAKTANADSHPSPVGCARARPLARGSGVSSVYRNTDPRFFP